MAKIITKIPVKSIEKKNEPIFFINNNFEVFVLAKKAIEKEISVHKKTPLL